MCPLEHTELTCHVRGNVIQWYHNGSELGIILALINSSHTFTTLDYSGTFINHTNVSGMWTKLSFTATTNKNGTIVQCWDISVASLPSNCTIMIAGIKRFISLYNCHYVLRSSK